MKYDREIYLLETGRNISYGILGITEGVAILSGGYTMFSQLLNASKETVSAANTLFFVSFPTSVILCGIVLGIENRIADLKNQE